MSLTAEVSNPIIRKENYLLPIWVPTSMKDLFPLRIDIWNRFGLRSDRDSKSLLTILSRQIALPSAMISLRCPVLSTITMPGIFKCWDWKLSPTAEAIENEVWKWKTNPWLSYTLLVGYYHYWLLIHFDPTTGWMTNCSHLQFSND